MIKLPCHRLGLLSASLAVSAMIAGCGESGLGPDSNAQGSGGTGAGASTLTAAACLACAEPKCPNEAKTCSSTQGCGDIASCLLGCSIKATSCGTTCSTADSSNANASSAAAAYAACAIVACPNACTPAATGSGGSGSPTPTGQGGSSTASGGQATTSGGSTATATGGTAATITTNLIQDPDFSAVSAYWSATANGGDTASMSCSGGQCCITNEYSTWFAFSLGYPRSSLQAFALDAGATYTLSFRARGTGVNTVEVKVGGAVSPYTSIYSSLVTVSSTLSEYTRQFTPTAASSATGLVFNVELAEYGSICFSSVSLIKT